MSWAEIKKSINSNLETPLDEKIDDIGDMFGLQFVSTYNATAGSSEDHIYSISNMAGIALFHGQSNYDNQQNYSYVERKNHGENDSAYTRIAIGGIRVYSSNLGLKQASTAIIPLDKNGDYLFRWRYSTGYVSIFAYGGGIS